MSDHRSANDLRITGIPAKTTKLSAFQKVPFCVSDWNSAVSIFSCASSFQVTGVSHAST
jgi:hypothetical protein